MSTPAGIYIVPRDVADVPYWPSVIPVQAVEPAATAKFWVDTTSEPPTLKGWDGAAWVTVGGGGGTDAEVVRDTIAAALVSGSNVTITPNDGANTITIAASSGGAALWVPPIALAEGAYCLTNPYGGSWTTGPAGNSGGLAAGYPFSLGRDCTTDSVSINNTAAGAAGTFSRFMIYAADPATGKPGTLVFDSGQEAQDATGIKTISGTINWTAGLYWAISVRAVGAGSAASYTAFTPGTIPFSSSAFDVTNKTFDLGSISSTSAPPATWANSTYSPITRPGVAFSLHVTAVV